MPELLCSPLAHFEQFDQRADVNDGLPLRRVLDEFLAPLLPHAEAGLPGDHARTARLEHGRAPGRVPPTGEFADGGRLAHAARSDQQHALGRVRAERLGQFVDRVVGFVRLLAVAAELRCDLLK